MKHHRQLIATLCALAAEHAKTDKPEDAALIADAFARVCQHLGIPPTPVRLVTSYPTGDDTGEDR